MRLDKSLSFDRVAPSVQTIFMVSVQELAPEITIVRFVANLQNIENEF
tara:strand:+ start:103603 stop:103746 length:144 start_codon:yes stop_codon:yes gene_type:complete